jgi:anaerobic selenocysteine-containing dehydrogenase
MNKNDQNSRRLFLKASLGGAVAATTLALGAKAETQLPETQPQDHSQPQQRWKMAGSMRMVPVTDDQ